MWRKHFRPDLDAPWHEFDDDDEEVLAEHLKMEMVNEILEEFFKQHNVKRILGRIDQYIGGVGIKYKYRDLRYSGTLEDYRTGAGDGFHHCLTIRISSDGFRYPAPPRQAVKTFVRSHGSMRGWAVFTEEYLTETFPALATFATSIGCKASFLYNQRLHRIDIKFVPADSDPDSDAIVYLALEAGSPDAIDSEDYYAYFGLKRQTHQ